MPLGKTGSSDVLCTMEAEELTGGLLEAERCGWGRGRKGEWSH